MILNVNDMPPARCPVCFVLQNAATQVDNQFIRPQPGDFSLCFSCGAALRFGPKLELELAPTFDELVASGELDERGRRHIQRLQQQIRVPRCSVEACDWPAPLLCDYPDPRHKNGTCNAKLCEHHARTMAVDVHHCPAHAGQAQLPLGGAP